MVDTSRQVGAPCPAAARPFVLAATIGGSAMAFIDGSVVSIAVPAIQRDFGADLLALQWVVNVYLIILGALILVGGGLGDRIGRRRVFMAGVTVFSLSSLACAIAPDVITLIGARAVQGIGAALLVPQSLALIAANFPKDIRGQAIGTWAAASAVTTALGPPLGGFLIDLLSWRAAFWINLPLSLVTLWLAWRYVPESRDEGERGELDWQGAAFAVVGFGLLTYGLSALSDGGGGPLIAGAAILLGAIGIAVFVAIEMRARNPIMPPVLFRSPVFSAANVITVLLYGSLSGTLFLVPFDLLARRGLTGAETGLALLPMGIIIGLFSRLTGSLADTYGPRPFLIAGSAVVGLGCLGFTATAGNIWLGAVVPMVLVASGMAIVVSPLTTAVMNASPEGRSGAASGVNNAASRLAGGLAIAIVGATAGLVFAMQAPTQARFGTIPPVGAAARAAVESAFLAGYRAGMLADAVLAFLAALAALLLIPRKEPVPAALPEQ